MQKLIGLAGETSSLSDVLYYDAARFAKQESGRVGRFAEQLLGGKAGRETALEREPDAWEKKAADIIERLMGRKPELRFAFIQENAKRVRELDV